MKQIKLACMVLLLSSLSTTASAFYLQTAEEKSQRSSDLNELQSKDMIVYGPKDAKASITVFTDLDCGYCRKLHHDIPALTQAGIQVRYLAFPRSGFGSKAYNTLVSIWCAKDRNQALSNAMEGQSLNLETCESPVQDQYRLGRKWGIRGTPTLVYSDGTIVPGYIPVSRLIREAISHEKKSE